MNIKSFMNTIYLGDRYAKAVIVDSYKKEIKIKVSEISRIRSSNGVWDYYNDENIVDGYIVFSGISYFSIDPLGIMPNDEIYDWEVFEKIDGTFEVIFYIGSCNEEAEYTEVKLRLIATSMCLEEAEKPGERIYE